MDHQKPEDPVQTLFQRIHKNMDRLNFLSTHIPRPACLTWPGDTDLKKPLPYLPQEIQDQICRYAVSTTYEMGESRSARPARTTQAILMSSKRNYDGGLKSLYANGVFRYTIAVNDTTTDFMPAFTDDMMHIELVVDCHRLPGMEVNDELEVAKLRLTQLVEMFGGTHLKRKTFRYYLRRLDWLKGRDIFSRILQPLWQLQGFDTVRIEFDVVGGQFLSGFVETTIKDIFHYALGSGTVRDGRAKGFFVCGTRYVEFHPNGYRATKALTEK